MTTTRFDVCAIGNAIVDVIANCDDAFLSRENITKGGMTLIDEARAKDLYGKVGPAVEMSGGSAANTVAGIASLGGRPAYIGKVRDDQLGDIFRHDMKAAGVHYDSAPLTQGPSTARCISLVTPDAQRSMSTFLGASVEFSAADIQAELIQNAQVTYLEGYLFDKPMAQTAFIEAARLAKEAGRKRALTLSDTFCVERHRDAFRALVKGEIDILFSNEQELCALYQTTDLTSAMEQARAECDIVISTRSAEGALIAHGKNTTSVKAHPVSKLVDTTGAGDLFAAGFLFGYTQGRDMQTCGTWGGIAAAEVISHYGPRPQAKLKSLIAA